MPGQATILSAARNAESTIGRAVASALSEPDCAIVLIDDFSSDATVERAVDIAGPRLRVVRPPSHETLARTRQFGLESVETPYGVWLDADDALLPGRPARLVEAMERTGAAIAADEVELFDGPTDRFLRRMEIPGFLFRDAVLVRQFERNYLPGAGQIAFQTETARELGYEPGLIGTEDTNFLLRSALARLPVALVPQAGYRMSAYPGSVSRQLERQRAMTARSLACFTYEAVRKLYSAFDYPPPVTVWALHSMALFREDYASARRFLDEREAMGVDEAEVLEPDGPLPRPEGWRGAFAAGVLEWLAGNPSTAREAFAKAQAVTPTAESANNLGLAHRHLGEETRALTCFDAALERFPDYLDARLNRENPEQARITLHPLRMQASRAEYPQQHPQAVGKAS